MTVLRNFPILIAFFAVSATMSAQTGVVRSGTQAIPGATVTVTQNDKKIVTSTGDDGRYELRGLEPGPYAIQIQMFGFKPTDRKFEANTGPAAVEWTLELQPRQALAARGPVGGGPAASAQGTQMATEIEGALRTTPEAPIAAGDGGGNESFLVSGSLSQGLQSGQADSLAQDGQGRDFRGGGEPGGGGNNPFGPQAGAGGPGGGRGGGGPGGPGGGGRGGGGGFGGGQGGGPGGQRRRDPNNPGQPGAFFGNRANRGREGIHGALTFSLRNSALDARSYSFTGEDTARPAYAQTRFGLVAGGPLRIPKLLKTNSTFFFLNYNGSRSKNPYQGVATLPTLLERSGNFSQSSTNTPVTIYDPANGAPFPNNQIPLSRINPAALGLLNLIPFANHAGGVQNYQILASTPQNSDNLGLRLNQNVSKKDRLALNLNYQRRSGGGEQLFGYRDQTSGSGVSADLSYTRNLTQRMINVARFNFNRNAGDTVPFFAYKTDVASLLGIRGTAADPINYGPPNLSFTNFGGLNDASPVTSRIQTSAISDSVSLVKGQHSLSTGFDFRRTQTNIKTDSNARGTFTFSGIKTSALDANGFPVAGTGYDFADFLLGLPQSSSVRFGTSSTYFRGNNYSAFVQDDWRVRSNLTLNLGLRWEYYSPLTEKYGHIANLDIAPGFTGVAVVTPGQPAPYAGPLPGSLVRPDWHNFAPRGGLAWKPRPGKSTQVRASYGIYYNGGVFSQIASRLASQPPFAQTTTLTTSLADVLTLQNGLATNPDGKLITNTFAVDPNYKPGYAQSWNASVQQDVGHGIIVETGYLGTKGTRLDIQRLPNRAAPGSPLTAEQRRLLGNAVGFTFESSEGNSISHAAQLRVIRRFRRGISANVFYAFAKSIDNSSTFGGAGNTVAQDDKNLRAERGLSSFDQRHNLNVTWTLSTGTQSKRKLFHDWGLNGGFNISSGTPLTARVLGNRADTTGTGAVGSGRADSTGADVSGGQFFNLGAFTLPPSGRYGDAGRNTIPGPSRFSMNSSISRSFSLGERRRLEFRVEANNLLNHVSFTNLSTVVNASNYGFPIAAASMRTIQANVRLRF